MGAKRGESGLSLVVGIDKPAGMSSHDVVNRCRRIFGERRVGHAGTLDPFATGVLPVFVGPAARLDAYLVGHDKDYLVRIAFGTATDTEDATGQVIDRAPIPELLAQQDFARDFLQGQVGARKQMPPAYSAIKVGGVKACDAARAGKVIDLTPRDIEVYAAELISVDASDGELFWDVRFSVSSGTYVRSLARDIGIALGCPAHVSQLRRLRVGKLSLDRCVSLETLERLGRGAALDPVGLLGMRVVFPRGEAARKVANGNALSLDDAPLHCFFPPDGDAGLCACMSGTVRSSEAPEDGELVCVVVDNALTGLYRYDAAQAKLVAACIFSQGVSRGFDSCC